MYKFSNWISFKPLKQLQQQLGHYRHLSRIRRLKLSRTVRHIIKINSYFLFTICWKAAFLLKTRTNPTTCIRDGPTLPFAHLETLALLSFDTWVKTLQHGDDKISLLSFLKSWGVVVYLDYSVSSGLFFSSLEIFLKLTRTRARQ